MANAVNDYRIATDREQNSVEVRPTANKATPKTKTQYLGFVRFRPTLCRESKIADS